MNLWSFVNFDQAQFLPRSPFVTQSAKESESTSFFTLEDHQGNIYRIEDKILFIFGVWSFKNKLGY